MKEFSVMNFLSTWLMRPRLGDDKPPSFWPSSASAYVGNKIYGTCRRRVFLQYLRMQFSYSEKTDKKYSFWKDLITIVEGNITPESKYLHWIWEQGNLFEDHVLDLIKESGIFIATQTQVYIPKYNVSGKIDAISFNPDTGKYIICEVKSVYGPNGEKTLGSDYERSHNISGTPRDYNLMQAAIYQWHYADEKFEYGQLIYGDRGNGKYAVYQVDVEKELGTIRYRTIDPFMGEWTTVEYTIFDVLESYLYLQECMDTGKLPKRDFDLIYSDEQLKKIVSEAFNIIELDKDEKKVESYSTVADFLTSDSNVKVRKFKLENKNKFIINKADSEQFVKYIDRETNGGKKVKRPDVGDYQCTQCPFQTFCYDENSKPKEY